METENTTPENTETTPAPEAAAAPTPEAQAAAQVPGVLGKLTPEEQQALLLIRQESQQLLAKVGEHEVLKGRLLAKLDELDEKGQGHINAISKRFNLEDGQQWVALQDGTVRLVNPPQASQAQGGAPASS
jgi:hypothetical protein